MYTAWEHASTVRTRPLPDFDAAQADRLCFDPGSVPLTRHPDLQGHPRLPLLLNHSLYGFLRFTTYLETKMVNPVAGRIALGESVARCGRVERLDALKIYCDEGYHALVCSHFMGLVEKRTGVSPIPAEGPSRLAGLKDDLKRFPDRERTLLEEAFVIVSETLITNTLYRVGQESRLHPGVKRVMEDHAKDEAHHHSFFTRYMGKFWEALSEAERGLVLEHVPIFLHHYFMPDPGHQIAILSQLGFDRSRAEDILLETYRSPEFNSYLKDQSRSTVGLFRRAGELDCDELLTANPDQRNLI